MKEPTSSRFASVHLLQRVWLKHPVFFQEFVHSESVGALKFIYKELLGSLFGRHGVELAAIADAFRSPTEVGAHTCLAGIIPLALGNEIGMFVWSHWHLQKKNLRFFPYFVNRFERFMIDKIALSVYYIRLNSQRSLHERISRTSPVQPPWQEGWRVHRKVV